MNKFTVRREGVVILSGVEGELFEAQRIDLYNRTGARDFAETIQPEDKISWDDQAATIVKVAPLLGQKPPFIGRGVRLVIA